MGNISAFFSYDNLRIYTQGIRYVCKGFESHISCTIKGLANKCL
ncbi:Uncharacterised protein [Raoultella terrigena]|uniref:Uncharacterized protein n=1 Tax=Raoultella terrigena TaxID=577 RepID=A0A7Z8Z9K1_RAOTE|nr:Uncharacterised protein [Raoultella terrigena]